jgi:hypothetical protein
LDLSYYSIVEDSTGLYKEMIRSDYVKRSTSIFFGTPAS